MLVEGMVVTPQRGSPIISRRSPPKREKAPLVVPTAKLTPPAQNSSPGPPSEGVGRLEYQLIDGTDSLSRDGTPLHSTRDQQFAHSGEGQSSTVGPDQALPTEHVAAVSRRTILKVPLGAGPSAGARSTAARRAARGGGPQARTASKNFRGKQARSPPILKPSIRLDFSARPPHRLSGSRATQGDRLFGRNVLRATVPTATTTSAAPRSNAERESSIGSLWTGHFNPTAALDAAGGPQTGPEGLKLRGIRTEPQSKEALAAVAEHLPAPRPKKKSPMPRKVVRVRTRRRRTPPSRGGTVPLGDVLPDDLSSRPSTNAARRRSREVDRPWRSKPASRSDTRPQKRGFSRIITRKMKRLTSEYERWGFDPEDFSQSFRDAIQPLTQPASRVSTSPGQPQNLSPAKQNTFSFNKELREQGHRARVPTRSRRGRGEPGAAGSRRNHRNRRGQLFPSSRVRVLESREALDGWNDAASDELESQRQDPFPPGLPGAQRPPSSSASSLVGVVGALRVSLASPDARDDPAPRAVPPAPDFVPTSLTSQFNFAHRDNLDVGAVPADGAAVLPTPKTLKSLGRANTRPRTAERAGLAQMLACEKHDPQPSAERPDEGKAAGGDGQGPMWAGTLQEKMRQQPTAALPSPGEAQQTGSAGTMPQKRPRAQTASPTLTGVDNRRALSIKLNLGSTLSDHIQVSHERLATNQAVLSTDPTSAKQAPPKGVSGNSFDFPEVVALQSVVGPPPEQGAAQRATTALPQAIRGGLVQEWRRILGHRVVRRKREQRDRPATRVQRDRDGRTRFVTYKRPPSVSQEAVRSLLLVDSIASVPTKGRPSPFRRAQRTKVARGSDRAVGSRADRAKTAQQRRRGVQRHTRARQRASPPPRRQLVQPHPLEGLKARKLLDAMARVGTSVLGLRGSSASWEMDVT